MMLGGKPIEPGKKYKVAGWASVAEGISGQPVWEVVAAYLRSKKVIPPPNLNLPQLSGVSGNPGIAYWIAWIVDPHLDRSCAAWSRRDW